MVKTRKQKVTAVCLVMHCTPVSFALKAVITKHLCFLVAFLEFLAVTHWVLTAEDERRVTTAHVVLGLELTTSTVACSDHHNIVFIMVPNPQHVFC